MMAGFVFLNSAADFGRDKVRLCVLLAEQFVVNVLRPGVESAALTKSLGLGFGSGYFGHRCM